MDISKKIALYDIPSSNNFDLLRFFFAIVVFCAHYDVLHGTPVVNCPIGTPKAVGGFFVISGLLIYRSYCRCSSLKSYAIKRSKRILPAYCLIVCLSVFLFAPFSELSLSEYFTSKDVYAYLLANLSFQNFIHPSLPGVLNGVAINPSLWTIKIEVFMYILVPLFAILFNRSHRSISILLAVILSLSSAVFRWLADVQCVAVFDLIGKWILLSAYFVVGVSIYLYFDTILRYKNWLALISFPLLFLNGPVANFFHPFGVGMIIVWFAFSFPFLNGFGKLGDSSYGIYVYHGPIVCLTICLGIEANWLCFVLTALVVLTFAFLSWHCMERRILGR